MGYVYNISSFIGLNPLHRLFLQDFKFYRIKPFSISDDVTSSSDEGGEGKISKKGKKAKEAERVKKRLEEIASVTFFCSIFNRDRVFQPPEISGKVTNFGITRVEKLEIKTKYFNLTKK